MIAYLGCSNTAMAVAGYETVGGASFWPSTHAYNGGTILQWAGGSYWPAFDALLAEHPNPDRLWLNICVKAGDDALACYKAAQRVRLAAKSRIPAVKLYLSALNPYPDHVCTLSGGAGHDISQMIVDAMVGTSRGLKGPKMPGLGRPDVAGDGCHPNAQGMAKLGQALKDFFG